VQNLFHFPGAQNPRNIEQVVRKAFLNLHQLKKAGFEFNGVSANYNRKKKWFKNPKLSISGLDGRISVDLIKTTTPTASRFMIAVLYCTAYLGNKTKSADLFYNDQHGKNQSIASRHGPEHSEYMQSLISKMNDENFMLELNGLIENPLPENLSELQRSIIDATKIGIVSGEEVRNLMDTHDCSATDIQREYERLKVIMEEDNRVPDKINFPKIDLLEHEEIIDTQTTRQEILDLKSAKDSLRKEVQSTKQELHEAQSEIKRLLGRNILLRIFNR
jgi:FtsZ-binding cell division protein ZapB